MEMLHEGILHKCIKQLLEKKRNMPLPDMAEDLECLCQIMKTVGRRLDTDKAKVRLNNVTSVQISMTPSLQFKFCPLSLLTFQALYVKNKLHQKHTC